MMSHGFFTFHIVDESPWPLCMSLSAFALMVSIVEFTLLMPMSIMKIITMIAFSLLSFNGWVRDISCEGAFLGSHTSLVQSGLKMGFVLFILSEVMFFASFFWSLFYFSAAPSISIGGWPPVGLSSINPLEIPLLGSLLLMSSGVSVTWSHYSMLAGNKTQTKLGLILTLILGLAFSAIQAAEYLESSFSFSDSSYGSIFYMATGFHGLHVLIGSLFLLVCLSRIIKNQLSSHHHIGFEFAIWYWHFVDVVWLVLYVCVYWWGW